MSLKKKKQKQKTCLPQGCEYILPCFLLKALQFSFYI